jgi:predicted transcriptional regulator
MISLHSEKLLETNIEDLVITSEKVAHVQVGNPLEHALLVLIKSGYSAVPVLDSSYKFHGVISKTVILDKVLGIERIEMERLSHIKVQEVMNCEIPTLRVNDSFKQSLKLLIDHPFVCIVDDENNFKGILTRRAILKALNRHIYQLNK